MRCRSSLLDTVKLHELSIAQRADVLDSFWHKVQVLQATIDAEHGRSDAVCAAAVGCMSCARVMCVCSCALI
jgi:hypothetical protein